MMKNEKRQSRSIAKRLKGRTRTGSEEFQEKTCKKVEQTRSIRRRLGMVISKPESETLQRRSNGQDYKVLILLYC